MTDSIQPSFQIDTDCVTLDKGKKKVFYSYNVIDNDLPTLLYLHGAGGTLWDWPPLLREMDKCAVYTLDLPGHGDSDAPSHDSIEAYADDVLDFIETMTLERVILVGHSLGGAIAMTLALRQDARIAGLVLVGTGAKMPVTDKILDGLQMDFEGTVEFIMKYAWNRGTPPSLVSLGTQHMLKNEAQVVHGDFLACSQFDVKDQLSEIAVPTLVIAGNKDMMMDVSFSEHLAENIPNATLVTLNNTGHMIAQERPQLVADAITEFIDAQFS